MRYVNSVTAPSANLNTRQISRPAAASSIKPVAAREPPASGVEHHQHLNQVFHQFKPATQLPLEDRRKACRRVKHQPVLVELRSGIDRRHQNLLEGDVAEHIDVEA